ncbi:MAG: hypothetical protein DELT_01595 [Desulfovibrio sp.]
MRIYYRCSEYISYKRTGAEYMACLTALGHTLTNDPVEADLFVLHDEPVNYAALLRDIPPKPGQKIVGYAVWETPELPKAYIDGVKLVDAVWTCSAFSRAAFVPYARTFVVPHVVRRAKPSPDDIAWARARLGMNAEGARPFYFYTIVDTVNPRKNAEALLTAFAAAFGGRADTRLVVKQYRKALDLAAVPGVIDIPEMLSDGRLAALHAVCDAYVSAHHAEAWGLPLSEALAFGNLVIATGYSGNMEFMNESNSFPVPYIIAPVSPRICGALPHLYHGGMTWADIDGISLARIMNRVRSFVFGSDFRKNAADSVKPFSSEGVQAILQEVLAAL